MNKGLTICWFGIYRASFGRNKVYMSGLKENGVNLIECHDDTPGLGKFLRLWRKHSAIDGKYDAMVVGYPGQIVVPLAKLISHKPVILDALCTLYEGEVISRGRYMNNPVMKAWIWFIDWLAVKLADHVLVESQAQKEYFIKQFNVSPNKVSRVFTGVDDSVFFFDPAVTKHPEFTVVFRGRLLPEAGVKHVVRAAKLLEDKDVRFVLIGGGLLEHEVLSEIATLSPKNLEWASSYLPNDEIRKRMLECHAALGQFENHERLSRTIPHKAFEALNMKLPYITSKAKPVEEIFADRQTALFVNPADPHDLAAKILELKHHHELLHRLAENGLKLYESRLSPEQLGREIIDVVHKYRPK